MQSTTLTFVISRALPLLVSILWTTHITGVEAATLQPATVKAWTAYAQATERRIAAELSSHKGFLAMDFLPEAAASSERREVMAGGIPVSKMVSTDVKGNEIRVPVGMIHHWRGSVFIRGVTLEDVLARVANPTATDTRQEDVLESTVLERGPDSLRLYLKLQRSKLVTVVYNTEHQVQYFRYGPTRAASKSVATKIAELEHPFTKEESEKPQGQDRGFLWRLNSYWRYEQVDGGIIVECESISLSRTIPSFLVYLVRPLIDRVAGESMERTLSAMRDRFLQARGINLAQTSQGK